MDRQTRDTQRSKDS